MSTNAIAGAVAPVVNDIEARLPPVNVASSSRPSWYAIARKEGTVDETEIRIYEDIGVFGITAKQFADELETIDATTIHVRLNTDGGEAFDGIAMHNALKAHPAKVVVHIDGIAASAGSIVAMSGDEILMADNAFLMIHEARGGMMGEADEMRRYADVLDKINDVIASTYQARAGKTRKYWRERMAEENWFNAEEAKAEGLSDAIETPAGAVKNRFDFRIYNHAKQIPDAVVRAWGKSTVTPAPDVAPRGEAAPVIPMQETSTMSTEAPVAPAQNSAAGGETVTQNPVIAHAAPLNADPLRATEIQGYVEQGRQAGLKEGRTAEQNRCKAIADACPGKPKMALDAFIGGQTVEAVKLAFESAAAAEVVYEQRIAQMQEDNRRQVALAAAGGYPGGVAMGITDGADGEGSDAPMDAETAKATATREWDRQPNVRKGFSSKENYVAWRSAQLRGHFSGATAKASA